MNRVLQDELMRTVNSNKDLFTFFSGRTMLITGATGLIGSMLIKSIMTANDVLHTNIRVIGHVRNIEKAEAVFEGFRRDTFTITKVNVKDIDEPIDYIVHTNAVPVFYQQSCRNLAYIHQSNGGMLGAFKSKKH